MGATRDLAEFVVTCPRESITPKAKLETERAFLDLLGAAIAGASEPHGRILSEFVRRTSASGAAGVIASGFRVSAPAAALANGTIAHAQDYDDMGINVGHPTVAVVPAGLAVAEEVGATGDEFVAAIVLGYEVAGRVGANAGAVTGPESPYRRGFHGTSIYGLFGATAAAGRLLRLNTEQMRHAFGIVASHAGGVRANFGTMTKPLHAGEIGRAGVTAAMLAHQGLTANPDILEAKYGWGDAFIGRGAYDPSGFASGLGAAFLVEEGMDFKRYPCCGANHAPIDAVTTLMSQHGIRAEDIAEIEVDQSGYVAQEILVYPWPETGLQGKFSLAYNVAAAMSDGTVTPATFRDERIARYASLRAKIKINPMPDAFRGVAVRVRTTDGRQLSAERTVADGDHTQPWTWDALVSKFRDNAEPFLTPAEVDQVVDMVRSLPMQRSLEPLMTVLCKEKVTPA